MKLTTNTSVSLDGVMQGLGGPEEDRRGGFERGGWAMHVQINGGADVARRFLNAGLLDEIRLHLAPIILGARTRLFDGVRTDVQFVPREAQNAPVVTHLIYDVERPIAEH